MHQPHKKTLSNFSLRTSELTESEDNDKENQPHSDDNFKQPAKKNITFRNSKPANKIKKNKIKVTWQSMFQALN